MKLVSINEIGMPDDLTFAESAVWLADWCEKNDAHYYGRPKDLFYEYEAVQEARAEGKSVVVVEDLS